MILFEKIRWKNFLSTGNQYIDVKLNENSTNLIIGTNGAGKSTILDALTFSLFGKPFRKINKPQLVNSTNDRDCNVEVEFSIGSTEWKVVRGIKPNIFEIWRDGMGWFPTDNSNVSTAPYSSDQERNQCRPLGESKMTVEYFDPNLGNYGSDA